MTISPPQDVDAVHFINSKVGWASEDNYTRLLMTTDGGTRWRVLSLPESLRKRLALTTGLVGATFLSPSDFWATADRLRRTSTFPDVFLFHTTDGGRNWVQAGSFPNDEEAWVSFLNDQRGWVAVDNGEAGGSGSVSIYETTNGGRHWSLVSRSRSLTGAPGTPGNPGTLRRYGPQHRPGPHWHLFSGSPDGARLRRVWNARPTAEAAGQAAVPLIPR